MHISVNFTAGAGCETFRTSKSFFLKEDVWIPEFSALRSSGEKLTIHIRFTIQTINPHLQKPKTVFKPLLPAFGVGFSKNFQALQVAVLLLIPPSSPPKFLTHLPDFVLSSPFGGKGLWTRWMIFSLVRCMTAKADRSSLGRTLWNGNCMKLSCHSP